MQVVVALALVAGVATAGVSSDCREAQGCQRAQGSLAHHRAAAAPLVAGGKEAGVLVVAVFQHCMAVGTGAAESFQRRTWFLLPRDNGERPGDGIPGTGAFLSRVLVSVRLLR